jgi:hypothetical protein
LKLLVLLLVAGNRWRLHFGRIEDELPDVQRHFPAINAVLNCRRDDLPTLSGEHAQHLQVSRRGREDACATSFDNVDSDLTAGTQKIAAVGEGLPAGKQRLP